MLGPRSGGGLGASGSLADEAAWDSGGGDAFGRIGLLDIDEEGGKSKVWGTIGSNTGCPLRVGLSSVFVCPVLFLNKVSGCIFGLRGGGERGGISDVGSTVGAGCSCGVEFSSLSMRLAPSSTRTSKSRQCQKRVQFLPFHSPIQVSD